MSERHWELTLTMADRKLSHVWSFFSSHFSVMCAAGLWGTVTKPQTLLIIWDLIPTKNAMRLWQRRAEEEERKGAASGETHFNTFITDQREVIHICLTFSLHFDGQTTKHSLNSRMRVLLNCLICFVTLIKHLSSVNRVTSCHWARPSSPLSSAVFIHVDMKNERPDAKMEHSPSNSAGPTPTIIMERGSDAACTGMTINHQFD